MNRLVIIGNGFDLAHGYKTSYSDFLLWYLKDCFHKIDDQGNYEDGLITLSCGGAHFDYDELDRIKDVRGVVHYAKKKYIEVLFHNVSIEKENRTNLFFLLVHKAQNLNWVDIEKEYFRILKEIVKDSDRLGYVTDHEKEKLFNLNNELEFIKDKLIVYLKMVDAEIVSKRLVNEVLNKKMQEPFLSNQFSENFEFFGFPPDKTLILNFNYTATFENYPSFKTSIQTIRETNHIHGKLSDENSIIFGFGDEMDDIYAKMEKLDDNDFFQHIKSFKYSQNDRYWKLLRFLEPEQFQVYIMGHSCGLSDRTMLNSIFEHENCRSIKLFYYQKEDGTTNYTELTHEISRHFKDKAAMRSKIVPFNLSEPLPNYKPEEKS